MKSLSLNQLENLLLPTPSLSAVDFARGEQIVQLHFRQEFPARSNRWRRLLLPLLASTVVLATLLVFIIHKHQTYSDLNSIEHDLNQIQISDVETNL